MLSKLKDVILEKRLEHEYYLSRMLFFWSDNGLSLVFKDDTTDNLAISNACFAAIESITIHDICALSFVLGSGSR